MADSARELIDRLASALRWDAFKASTESGHAPDGSPLFPCDEIERLARSYISHAFDAGYQNGWRDRGNTPTQVRHEGGTAVD